MKKILSCVLMIIALVLAVSGGKAIPAQEVHSESAEWARLL